MDWETFHNKFIEATEASCHNCNDSLYESEGFVAKLDGKPVGFCSHACLEEWEADGNETDEWGCWIHKASEELLKEVIEQYNAK